MLNIEIRTFGSGSYTIVMDNVLRIIRKKRGEFVSKYHQDPKYIKVPERFTRALQMCMDYVAQKGEPNVFMGMQICETCTIQYPEQIEVF